MPSTRNLTLDLEQFRDLTLGDRQLMREIVGALIEDTSRYVVLLESAIRSEEQQRITRLARTAARACSNVGAHAAAAALQRMERHAEAGEFDACGGALGTLRADIERLRAIPLRG